MTTNNQESETETAPSELNISSGSDPFISVNGFGLEGGFYLLVGLTESGKVVVSDGSGTWSDVSPKV